MDTVGIVGGSGYMGGEALRLVLRHPRLELAWVTSRTPGPVERAHPNLFGSGLSFVRLDGVVTPDFVLLALPTAASIEVTDRFLAGGARVIDLGSAFRLRDRQIWERVYGQTHSAWHLAENAVYGISELHEREIAGARLIANPGCFASAAILGLAPLVQSGLIDSERIVVTGLSGTAGAGMELSRAIHHAEIGNNVVTYNAVGHRHTYEMEQELTAISERKVRVRFTPSYIPIVRGILNICHCFLIRAQSREQTLDLFRNFYRGHPFIRIYDQPHDEQETWRYRPYPWVSAVAGTNYCHIGLDVDEERQSVVVLSVLDSIGKGGASAGIENLNLMANFPRTEGLLGYGLHP